MGREERISKTHGIVARKKKSLLFIYSVLAEVGWALVLQPQEQYSYIIRPVRMIG